jgi:hypothetical protein
MREAVFEDGFTVFLEAGHRDGDRHAVGVSTDNNLGVVAKDILLADSIEAVERVMSEHPAPDGRLVVEPVAAGVAAGQIHAAIELTDMTLGLPVGEELADLRALALMRADAAWGYEPVGERPTLEREARDRLLDEFLSSPEGAGIAPDSESRASRSTSPPTTPTAGRCAGAPSSSNCSLVDWLRSKVIDPHGAGRWFPVGASNPSYAVQQWIAHSGGCERTPVHGSACCESWWVVGTCRVGVPPAPNGADA